jgi:hypothetical protein
VRVFLGGSGSSGDSVRDKLGDPAYSGFFLKFAKTPGNGSFHVPDCAAARMPAGVRRSTTTKSELQWLSQPSNASGGSCACGFVGSGLRGQVSSLKFLLSILVCLQPAKSK